MSKEPQSEDLSLHQLGDPNADPEWVREEGAYEIPPSNQHRLRLPKEAVGQDVEVGSPKHGGVPIVYPKSIEGDPVQQEYFRSL